MNPIEAIQEAINSVLEEFRVVEENHTLKDLDQKLINYLYNKETYTMEDVEILKILLN